MAQRTIPRSVLVSQAALITRIVRAGATKTQIAEAGEIHPSMISKYEPDSPDPREMTWDVVRRLADAFGWDVVMGAPAEAAGWTIARPGAEPARDLVGASVRAASEATDVPRVVVELGTRIHSAEGRERALREVREAIESLHAVEAGLLAPRSVA